ncbi:TetR/AcrR family transcriptional regulator C-terminal ligand-binding domain-containing protein [Streptomyces sp. NPDC014748]|uniref:TetR/AcrR family transcriptional regulator n=1 Tax=unclassified Streptomyces TaxID=2593676 RepID=UPI00146F7151|nr:TetR/AcrR family transcriptional regulator [Streptomyces sp. GMY02]NMO37723.1 TetR/AcrR family transcriptional regulator [Streptomyces sp. GMY02]
MSSPRRPPGAAQAAATRTSDTAPDPAEQAAAPDSAAAKGTRRRGEKLTRAVYLATLEELALTSFEELAFDKIAARAATGKSALYRRWDTPKELVLAALTDPIVGFGAPAAPATGTLRGDLTDLLGAFARVLGEPRGRALRPLMTQRPRHPELYGEVRRLVVEPYQRILLDVLRRAVDRGEADPRCVTPRVAAVGPRLVIAESMDKGTVEPAEVDGIVEEVLLPLTAVRP